MKTDIALIIVSALLIYALCLGACGNTETLQIIGLVAIIPLLPAYIALVKRHENGNSTNNSVKH